MHAHAAPAGGAFLIEEATPEQVSTPEALTAEARLMAKTMEDFIRKEVLPLTDRLEAQEDGLMRCLVQKAGRLGLLAAAVPEIYGGLDLSKSATGLLIEKMALYPSFSVSLGVQTALGTLPLLFFGTAAQKQQWLPKLASGEVIGAFSLSEANCGSDALSSQTRATLSPDGKHYLLNGTKMWTTNAGFADLFTVFAKIDGEQFTAFLVERDFPGVSLGREEHKLGLKGSSTRRVILDNAQVPVENVLGEIGKGHRVALYVLNIGRFQIGAGGLGGSKEAIHHAAQYARQRVQFGQPIANFGLIQHKLGEMAVRVFALESMIYRTAGYWDILFSPIDARAPDANEKYRAAAEEYAPECAILKFFGSEVLDYVVDEALQIHGGFGYTEEFPMARAYRDARINRIFEGTNEINRLTVLDQVMRRAMRGRLALPQAVAKLKDAVLSAPPVMAETLTDPLDALGGWVAQIRNVTLYVAGQAWEALGETLTEKQEIVAALADMSAALYALESSWLRCRKMQGSGVRGSGSGERPGVQRLTPDAAALAATQVYGNDACTQVEQLARYALAAFSAGDTLRTHASVVRRLLKPPLLDTAGLRRQIAAAVLEREAYPWSA
jgi:alkylation response protein AidB-like acyl-CoA dehydrogenase